MGLLFEVVDGAVVAADFFGIHAIADHVAIFDGLSDVVGLDREFAAGPFSRDQL